MSATQVLHISLAKLTADDSKSSDYFGTSVAIEYFSTDAPKGNDGHLGWGYNWDAVAVASSHSYCVPSR
jgi:FG-GAP repeat